MPKDNNGYDDLAKHILWGMSQDGKKNQDPAKGLFDIYASLVGVGFDKEQALELLKTMVGALFMKG